MTRTTFEPPHKAVTMRPAKDRQSASVPEPSLPASGARNGRGGEDVAGPFKILSSTSFCAFPSAV